MVWAVWIPDGIPLIHWPEELCVEIAHTFSIVQQCGMTCMRKLYAVLDIDGTCCLLAHDIRPKVMQHRDVHQGHWYDCAISVLIIVDFCLPPWLLIRIKRFVHTHTHHPVK